MKKVVVRVTFDIVHDAEKHIKEAKEQLEGEEREKLIKFFSADDAENDKEVLETYAEIQELLEEEINYKDMVWVENIHIEKGMEREKE